MATAAHLAMPGTACNHWLQQIDPLSTVHRRVRHVPRRRGAAVDQLESPRRPGCPRGFQQPAQHGCTAQERRERANRPPDHHSPSGCAQPWRDVEISSSRTATRGPFRTPLRTPGVYEAPWPQRAAAGDLGTSSRKTLVSAFYPVLPLILGPVQMQHAKEDSLFSSARSSRQRRRSTSPTPRSPTRSATRLPTLSPFLCSCNGRNADRTGPITRLYIFGAILLQVATLRRPGEPISLQIVALFIQEQAAPSDESPVL